MHQVDTGSGYRKWIQEVNTGVDTASGYMKWIRKWVEEVDTGSECN